MHDAFKTETNRMFLKYIKNMMGLELLKMILETKANLENKMLLSFKTFKEP